MLIKFTFRPDIQPKGKRQALMHIINRIQMICKIYCGCVDQKFTVLMANIVSPKTESV